MKDKSPYSNPWKTLSGRVVYDNPWIKLTEYQVINPGNKESIYGVVSFHNIAVGIVPLDKQLNTWLVGQYRYPLDQYSWEIPEGGGDPKLDPLLSAQRELLEETGLKADRWEKIQDIHTSNSTTNEIGHIYLATGLSQYDPEPEEDEQLIIRKMPFDEAYEMVLKGEITDSLSIAGIFKTKHLIEKGLIKL